MIEVRGILPPSVNSYWRGSCKNGYLKTYISKDGVEFKSFMTLKAREAKLEKIEKGVDCRLIYTMYAKSKGAKDLDNTLKALQDSLEGVAYDNDNQITEIIAKKYRHTGFNGFDVRIEKVSDEISY